MPKKPIVYLLVILPTLFAGGIVVTVGLVNAYAQLNKIPLAMVPDLNGILIAIPAFFIWIPIALQISNCVLFILPPFRRVAERYAASSQLPAFVDIQKQLARLALVIAIPCIPLIILGFVL